jgi:CxxC-x17-CxxC domain-containing protein
MRNFNNKYGGSSSRGDFRKGGYEKKEFGSRDRERSQMHEAICSDCGKRCEVPFRPSGDKPVYCSQCFTSHREPASNSFERKGYERPRFQNKDRYVSQSNNQYKEQFEILNIKLDKILKALSPVDLVKDEKTEIVTEKEKEIVKKKRKSKKSKK